MTNVRLTRCFLASERIVGKEIKSLTSESEKSECQCDKCDKCGKRDIVTRMVAL